MSLSADAPRRSTGVDVLDRFLGGGFPAGSLVALAAPPDSQSHLFLRAICSAHPSRYLSTYRPPAAVDAPADDVTAVTPASVDDAPDRVVDEVPTDGAVVVDRMNDVEAAGEAALREVLDDLSRRLRENDAVGLLHCLGDEDASERSLTLARADVVLRLATTVTSLAVDRRLVVAKARTMPVPREPIKLKLVDRVEIDTSRDIA